MLSFAGRSPELLTFSRFCKSVWCTCSSGALSVLCMHIIDKDADVAKLFERIQVLRSSYVNDELEAEEPASNSDLENALELDDEYFEEAGKRTKKPKSSCGASSNPSPAAPSTPAAVGGGGTAAKAELARFRSVPSIDRGFSEVTPTPPATPRPTSSDFTPPPMTAHEKAELTKVLQQIALLELSAHFAWAIL